MRKELGSDNFLPQNHAILRNALHTRVVRLTYGSHTVQRSENMRKKENDREKTCFVSLIQCAATLDGTAGRLQMIAGA